MKKITKILAALSFYLFLLVIDGCVIDCDCPSNILSFFDFQKIEQNVNSTSLAEFENLEIDMSFDSIYYLAQVKKPCWKLGLISTATACECIGTGEGGLKFPISQIKISTDQDINPDLLAGSSLDSIFYIIQLDYENNELSKMILSDIDLLTTNWTNWEGAKFQLQSVARPGELNIPYIFKIEFTKSNGEIVTSETPPITWN